MIENATRQERDGDTCGFSRERFGSFFLYQLISYLLTFSRAGRGGGGVVALLTFHLSTDLFIFVFIIN